MSNDPLSNPSSALPAPELSAAEQERADGTRRVLAAIDRIESAVRGDGTAGERLRTDLSEMAGAIAQARGSLASGTAPSDGPAERDAKIGLLLRQLEDRLGALIDVVGAVGPPPPASDTAQPAEPPPAAAPAEATRAAERIEDRVPTVSNVVSRLGRSGTALPDAVDWTAERTAPGTSDTPTVSMLEAMVEALAAEVPATPPREPEPQPSATAPAIEPEANKPPPAPPARFAIELPDSELPAATEPEPVSFAVVVIEPAAREPAPSPAAPFENAAGTAVAASEPSSGAPFVSEANDAEGTSSAVGAATESPVAETPEAAAPDPPTSDPPTSDPAGSVSDLMSRFSRMEAIPFLTPELGTAVIFTPRDPAPAQPSGVPGPERELESELIDLFEPIDAVAAKPASMLAVEAAAAIATEPTAAGVPELPETATERSPAATAELSEVPGPEPFGAPVPEPAGPQSQPADTDAILFEQPQPEPDPAAFLLGPAPVGIATQTIAPGARDTAASAPALTATPVAASIAAPAPAAAPIATPMPPRTAPRLALSAMPYDPLAPLNSMSDDEKIALFS